MKSQITLVFFLLLLYSPCLAQENKVEEFKPLTQLKALKHKLEATKSEHGYIKLTSREAALYCTVVDLKGLDLNSLFIYHRMRYALNLVEDCSFKQDEKVIRAISLLLEIAFKKTKAGFEIEYLFALGQKYFGAEPIDLEDIEVLEKIYAEYDLKLEEVKESILNETE